MFIQTLFHLQSQSGSEILLLINYPKGVAIVFRTRALAKTFGASMKPFWRPPFGAYNGEVLNIAAEEGFSQTIMWTLDSGDWIPTKSATAVKDTILTSEAGYIVVEHCNSPQSAQVLPAVLAGLIDKGLNVVTVKEIIK